MNTFEQSSTSGLAESDWVARERFYTALATSYAQCERYIARAMWMLIVSGAAFYLIDTASVSEVDLFGVKFENLDIVEKAIPAIASYYFMEFMASYLRVGFLAGAIEAPAELWPSLRKTAWISSPMLPSGLSVSKRTSSAYKRHLTRGIGDKIALLLQTFSEAIAGTALILGSLTGIVWAYIEIINKLAVDPLTWISLCGSVIFLISALSQFALIKESPTFAKENSENEP